MVLCVNLAALKLSFHSFLSLYVPFFPGLGQSGKCPRHWECVLGHGHWRGGGGGVERSAVFRQEGFQVLWGRTMFVFQHQFSGWDTWRATPQTSVKCYCIEASSFWNGGTVTDRQNAWNVKPSVDVLCVMQERIREMFENLMQVEHPNIVKFHKYWLDMRESRARVRLKTHLKNTSVNFVPNSDIHVFFLFVPHRWFLLLSICHLEVSSSFWRRPRKITKLWMWRWDVSSIIESEKLEDNATFWQKYDNLNTLVLSVCLRHGSVGARRYFLHSGWALRIQYYPLNSSANLLLKLKCVGKLKIFSQLNIQRQLCVGWFVQKCKHCGSVAIKTLLCLSEHLDHPSIATLTQPMV